MARRPAKFVGRKTGMGVTQYQDHTFSINDDRKLTDEELSKDWRREFPESKHVPPSQIRSIRGRYNIGSQGHGPATQWSYPYGPDRKPYDYADGRNEKPSRRNPPWHRDELILALDLYQRLGVADDSNPEVIALSELLNSLPIHVGRPDVTRFRNPNGVALKTANFRAIEHPGKGMSRGNKLEKAVWDEFARNSQRLAAAVAAIKEKYRAEGASASSTPSSEYVTSPKDIRLSLHAFNAEAVANQDRAKKLLQGTTYWVFEPDSGQFGPGKFVGLVGMTLERYESARHETDGGTTHRTIERVLDDEFIEREEWHPHLRSWGERLLGAAAFGKADTSKWRFVSLRSHSNLKSAGADFQNRRGTLDLGDRETVSYVLRQVERQVTPSHQRYQSRLGAWLRDRGVIPTFEKDFVDIRFGIAGREFVGEVKLTVNMSADDAFRTALGQVLFYAHVRCEPLPGMIVFLDREPDEKRLALASKLQVCVVIEPVDGKFRILNPRVAPALASVFEN